MIFENDNARSIIQKLEEAKPFINSQLWENKWVNSDNPPGYLYQHDTELMRISITVNKKIKLTTSALGKEFFGLKHFLSEERLSSEAQIFQIVIATKHESIEKLIEAHSAVTVAEGGREKRIESFLNKFPDELKWGDENNFFKEKSLIKFCPTNKMVCLIPLDITQSTTASGIQKIAIEQETLVDKRANSSSFLGMIVAAAPDATWYEEQFTGKVGFVPGDIVMYAKHRDTFVELADVEMLMVHESDIWSVIPDNHYHDFQFDAKGDVYMNVRHTVKNEKEMQKENDRKTEMSQKS